MEPTMLPGLVLEAEEWTHLERLLRQPLVSPEALAQELVDYVASLPALAASHPMMDLELAQAIAVACERLLPLAQAHCQGQQRALVQAAVRYFIEDEDAASDLDSFMGFDDDADVVNAVAVYLGHPEWTIEQ